MTIMVFSHAVAALALCAVTASASPSPSPSPLNVLMLAVDDLRPVGEVLGHKEILMPNLDALARRSTVFSNAFVQAATCGVSRSSLLTSRRPDTTQVSREKEKRKGGYCEGDFIVSALSD